MKRTSNETKQEGLNQEAKKKHKGFTYQAMMEDFKKIEEEMVTSFGKFGRCNAPTNRPCSQRFPAETVDMDGEVLCEECAIEIYGNENFRTVTDAVFHPSDATFRCPAYDCEGSCKSKVVSYRQFFIGSCCEPALRWLTKNENGQKVKLKVVEKLFNKSEMDLRKVKETSEELAEEAQNREEKLQLYEEKLENLKKSIAKSKKNKADKIEKLDVLKKNKRELNDDHRSASKRMMLLSYEYFDVATKIKDENGESCPLCGVEYGDKIHSNLKCKLPCSYKRQCGFKSCYHCLEDILLPRRYLLEHEDENEARICAIGKCPTCDTDFSHCQIIKA